MCKPKSCATGLVCRTRPDLLECAGKEQRVGVQPQYIVVDGKTFDKEELTLDNHVYRNCSMDRCKFYYSGGPFELFDTHITNSELILNQPAKNIYAAIQIFKMKSPSSTIITD
jgi:hypothetical protein